MSRYPQDGLSESEIERTMRNSKRKLRLSTSNNDFMVIEILDCTDKSIFRIRASTGDRRSMMAAFRAIIQKYSLEFDIVDYHSKPLKDPEMKWGW